jgi:hypothetical protein
MNRHDCFEPRKSYGTVASISIMNVFLCTWCTCGCPVIRIWDTGVWTCLARVNLTWSIVIFLSFVGLPPRPEFEPMAREFFLVCDRVEISSMTFLTEFELRVWLPAVAVPEEAGCASTPICDRRASSRSWDLFRMVVSSCFRCDVWFLYRCIYKYVYIYMSSWKSRETIWYIRG